MSARGCAAATCGEPMTMTIEVANGTSRRGMAVRPARSSISAMAIAAPMAPAMTAIGRGIPRVGSRTAASASRAKSSIACFIRARPKEKGGSPQGTAAR
jgi:hypothetical protein